MTRETTWLKTHCARMDHGGCAMLVKVKDNRIERIKGDPEGFLNRGYLCAKGFASAERLAHPDRLKHPLKRIGKRGEGQWQRISWDEALALITHNFKDSAKNWGSRSVAFCQGMPKGLEHFVLIRLANIFGSPNVVATQDVCHAPREISGVHTCGFYPVADLHHKSDLVLLWGSNIAHTNEEGIICSQLLSQLKKGTDLMVVDPQKIALVQKAKYWLQIRPGTDAALALGFLNVIISEGLYDRDFVDHWTSGFEELARHVKPFTPEKVARMTWVPADLIRAGARCYAEARVASIGWGNPIEQHISSFDTSRALVCLMAICGNLDIPGGNIKANEPDIVNLGKFVRADLIPSKRKDMIHAHQNTIPGLMTVPPAYFRKAVLQEDPYPVKAAYIQCANPLLSYADSQETFEALMKLDFVAVADLCMTPTAALADVVLPVATQFEFNDIGHFGLGHGIVLARPKLVDPPVECWPDIKILNELGKRMTSPEYWSEDYEALLDQVLFPSGLNYSQFTAKGYLSGAPAFKKYTNSGFKTPTGKVELALTRAAKFNLPALPQFPEHLQESLDVDYPLILTSSKNPYYLHSSYRWIEKLRQKSPRPIVQINPQTAAKQGIEENDAVVIETQRGQIVQFAHLTASLHPNVVSAAYGWWFPESGAESQYEWKSSNFNMLTSTAELGQAFGTPNLKGIKCRIRKE